MQPEAQKKKIDGNLKSESYLHCFAAICFIDVGWDVPYILWGLLRTVSIYTHAPVIKKYMQTHEIKYITQKIPKTSKFL